MAIHDGSTGRSMAGYGHGYAVGGTIRTDRYTERVGSVPGQARYHAVGEEVIPAGRGWHAVCMLRQQTVR